MIFYSKKNIIVLTFTITFFIYFILSVVCSKKISKNDSNDENYEIMPEVSIEEIVETEEIIETEDVEDTWKLEIPKINLNANIAEGTSQNVIANNVGHFTTTNVLDGNIGLAAHNRGFGENSFFKDIKYLNFGDEIIYKKDSYVKTYRVVKNVIIEETDWSYLQNTSDNRITLITCVEDMPDYRRCVQAVEI